MEKEGEQQGEEKTNEAKSFLNTETVPLEIQQSDYNKHLSQYIEDLASLNTARENVTDLTNEDRKNTIEFMQQLENPMLHIISNNKDA
ncbi:hypothetical protein AUK11_04475 [bacterium CG2_30_37_16]|nr:MAG: hypothetical protein AUK11_04475 [bacterium CG2_30_37_16]PIP30806.1 MAG: hypothetical protein COX25_02785 [bacterium (Candidatus Howlettbacteria) CG23_combo_of_CG06-09_8_20_14_all_37_9]PJB05161.1 MAG: hypothetical protein CO123_04630 [bacterium (Candidatus Howlettbacteria) CG_4_9_14_3_um_filter_37_10]